ncbi:MAG: hypothetical protein KZQ77_10600 [Candidatus Thiodiazotropha sp. (ex Notomyrtea botanica)]|nr:hypothetical protein [Candidatus Thiodiazotropha sp. (ex Notomyrtea botanica)]
MKKPRQNPLLLIALLLSCAFQGIQAAEHERFINQDSEGFRTSLRDVSDITVTQHLQEVQQDLQSRLSHLKQQVQKKSFKVMDTLITIVMPGGLVYAKLRHDSYKRSEQAMLQVHEELELISGDLVAFQTETGEFMVARVE